VAGARTPNLVAGGREAVDRINPAKPTRLFVAAWDVDVPPEPGRDIFWRGEMD
jgi:hypothetical protein